MDVKKEEALPCPRLRDPSVDFAVRKASSLVSECLVLLVVFVDSTSSSFIASLIK